MYPLMIYSGIRYENWFYANCYISSWCETKNLCNPCNCADQDMVEIIQPARVQGKKPIIANGVLNTDSTLRTSAIILQHSPSAFSGIYYWLVIIVWRRSSRSKRHLNGQQLNIIEDLLRTAEWGRPEPC